MGFQLPSSTGESRISEPSFVGNKTFFISLFFASGWWFQIIWFFSRNMQKWSDDCDWWKKTPISLKYHAAGPGGPCCYYRTTVSFTWNLRPCLRRKKPKLEDAKVWTMDSFAPLGPRIWSVLVWIHSNNGGDFHAWKIHSFLRILETFSTFLAAGVGTVEQDVTYPLRFRCHGDVCVSQHLHRWILASLITALAELSVLRHR